MSYNCDQPEQQDDKAPTAQPDVNEEQPEASGGQPQAAGGSEDIVNEATGPNNDDMVNKNQESRNEEMDYEDRTQSLKRQHITDSDSDRVSTRRAD